MRYIAYESAIIREMRRLWLLWVLLLVVPFVVRAQDGVRPIVRVGERTLTTADLERVKTLLPFERYKTTPNRTRLIDAVYVRFMIARAQLEQAGMERIASDDIDAFAKRIAQNVVSADLNERGYSLEAFTERALLVQRVLALEVTRASTDRWRVALEQWGLPGTNASNSTVQSAADRERGITLRALGSTPDPWWVGVRSMLLGSLEEVQAVAPSLRSEAAFIAAARQRSLVRRDLGGAYDGWSSPSVSVSMLEPELQIAVMNATRTGLLRVPAPFGRVWLLWLSQLPSSRAENLNDPYGLSAGLSFSLVGGSGTTPIEINFESDVQWLEATLTPAEFTLARIGAARLDLTDYIVAELLQNAQVSDPQIIAAPKASPTSDLEGFVTKWLEPRVIAQGLPYGGAGTEFGLEIYLAARVTVSVSQLKYAYWQKRAEYRYQNFETRAQCAFNEAGYAAKWREVVVFAPFPIWDGLVGNLDCDNEGETEPLPLPKPLRTTLTPIAGGYITGLLKTPSVTYFVALYGFHPDPLVKPFALVRGKVQQAYRAEVAKKQLEGFRAALYKRTNAENRAKAVVQELEQ